MVGPEPALFQYLNLVSQHFEQHPQKHENSLHRPDETHFLIRSEMEVYRLPESCVEVLVAILTEYHFQPGNVILTARMVFIHLPATPAERTSS